MKKIEEIKKSLVENRDNLIEVVDELNLKFTVDEVLNFDSITYNELNYNKKDYSILANESYSFTENEKIKKKSTRHNIFYMRVSKIKKMSDQKLFEMIENHIKFVKYYNQYKHTFKELELIVKFGFPKINRMLILEDFADNPLTVKHEEFFDDFIEFSNFYKVELEKIKNYNKIRSKYLVEKLLKK